VMSTGVGGMFNLLEAARAADVQQVILASGDASIGIFFYPQPIPLDEQAPLAAYPGYYAFSKVVEEVMLDQYRIQYGLGVTCLRFSWIQDADDILAYMTLAAPNFGGPDWKNLATNAKQKAFFTKRKNAVGCLVHPGGKPFVRHQVGIDDVIQAFLLALGNPAAIGQTFNVAAPTPFSYDVLSEYIADKLDLPVVEFVCKESHDFSINITKARAVLGYEPLVDPFAMVDKAIAFRKAGGKRRPVKYPG
jgi:UDP-glucose 4-epimerase